MSAATPLTLPLGKLLARHCAPSALHAQDRRVVIVYTEAWVFEALHAMLARSGFDVVGIPHDDLRRVGGSRLAPAVVLLQVPEPVGEHRHLADSVRSRWPASALIVVGGTTADAASGSGARALGARCVLRRPFSQKILTQVVREAIG